MSQGKDKPLAQNRKARHDYEIVDTFEAGIVLTGTEIKSVRRGKMNLQDGYISIHQGEAWLKNAHISPYDHGNIFNHDPLRDRKLLLHKSEILKLANEVKLSSMTIVPLKVYLVRGRAKLLIGLARGKNKYDKRHALKEKQAKRDIDRAMKNR
ncbi:SsrA-binding protein SmpB [Tuanshanicoccus lijuaniae]|uniref:SsrA-binding protein SmpB n=1 Tax=Aerococcaceae bacterium zg-1292 TaxID=2774330 RepID=UPI001938533A|nr:SsrA-binding protein SmpB [Aerococcaceae bacterium zg-1292]MBF6626722.1 SsrA-binding protein SmpB [Aerococcaceae bacterium zg-BR9]MBF6977566.1 SsrA-binding protein SmpB [Aerococcaceae bacterium zg-BR22]MBS4456679.1 SsrA-binding protein SmpB [Aerococcaceae bacterium zg-A91]MBS4458471.1 SsrA-binding protein SmpB [Aerococcaceae bacterium zg-BR33]